MKVAIRTSHWHSLDVYHDLDADDTVACRMGERDIPFRIVVRDALPDHGSRRTLVGLKRGLQEFNEMGVNSSRRTLVGLKPTGQPRHGMAPIVPDVPLWG